MQNKWTKEKLMKIQRMFERGKPRHEVAEELDVTESILINACRAHFIKFPVRKTTATVVYKKVCRICGKSFTRRISRHAKEPIYCSRKCTCAAVKKTQFLKTYRCINCKQTFERMASSNPKAIEKIPTFCSHKCRAEFAAKHVRKAQAK